MFDSLRHVRLVAREKLDTQNLCIMYRYTDMSKDICLRLFWVNMKEV